QVIGLAGRAAPRLDVHAVGVIGGDRAGVDQGVGDVGDHDDPWTAVPAAGLHQHAARLAVDRARVVDDPAGAGDDAHATADDLAGVVDAQGDAVFRHVLQHLRPVDRRRDAVADRKTDVGGLVRRQGAGADDRPGVD